MGIGPSTKETSLHHFRDPLLDLVEEDQDLEPAGIIVAGISADQEGKEFVAARLAAWIGALQPGGVLLSMDSWGNSHIDFNLVLDHLGMMKIPVVGLSFLGAEAQKVTGSRYRSALVDTNKNKSNKETEVLGENNITTRDARKALALLKLLRKEHT